MKHSRAGCAAALLAAALCAVPAARADGLAYAATALGGDLWRYDYTLTHDAAAPAFDGVTVYFELDTVQAILGQTAPAGWDGVLAQPDPALPDAGFVDWLHLAGPVPAGAAIGGFSVEFQALPGVTPGAQRYELLRYQPDFAVVATGLTSAVPEPGAAMLLAGGLAALALLRRRGQAATAGEARS